ncbi:hypothetical protein C8A03DRAFT_44815 [Achaetomium macrosporum]|uniref:Uncharacterized protein n=1 Tax=Achaetomium macrosporum TaxID=79813 RepID=A0AAN7HBE8_9PEZI|nr:hypothetical protein C8A03DRAFT_44815 [Achaetomium macrosporum]
MSHLSPLSAVARPDSRVSLARSDTTYHSFQDIELYEPEVPTQPSEPTQAPTVCTPPVTPSPVEEQGPVAREMRRSDSGYESLNPRDSLYAGRVTSSSTSGSSSAPRQHRKRPSTQRSPRSRPVSHRPRNGRQSVPVSRPGSSRSLSPQLIQPQQPVTYFHFPHFTSSDPALNEPAGIAADRPHSSHDFASVTPSYALRRSETPTFPLPPQTTHYWTSDKTRRVEYAAIDAASKGVRGWVLRHVVPGCFVPESKRRIGFEDDRGSVVRYRLDLESEDSVVEKAESVRTRRWKGWWFSMRRR